MALTAFVSLPGRTLEAFVVSWPFIKRLTPNGLWPSEPLAGAFNKWVNVP